MSHTYIPLFTWWQRSKYIS